jgi:hypothetical protein
MHFKPEKSANGKSQAARDRSGAREGTDARKSAQGEPAQATAATGAAYTKWKSWALRCALAKAAKPL